MKSVFRDQNSLHFSCKTAAILLRRKSDGATHSSAHLRYFFICCFFSFLFILNGLSCVDLLTTFPSSRQGWRHRDLLELHCRKNPAAAPIKSNNKEWVNISLRSRNTIQRYMFDNFCFGFAWMCPCLVLAGNYAAWVHTNYANDPIKCSKLEPNVDNQTRHFCPIRQRHDQAMLMGETRLLLRSGYPPTHLIHSIHISRCDLIRLSINCVIIW